MDKDLESFTKDLMLLINAFITDTGEMKEVLARLTEQMDTLEKDVGYMNKVVRDGNGRPPLMTRLEVLEEKINTLKETTNRWWQVWDAAVPGLLALLTTGAVVM